MTQITGRVFDSSTRGWIADVLVTVPQPDSSTYATYSYVDASLVARDASITVLFNENDAQDASIVSIRNVNTSQDASIVALRTKDTNIDTSLNAIWVKNNAQDASISAIISDTSSYLTGLLNPSGIYPSIIGPVTYAIGRKYYEMKELVPQYGMNIQNLGTQYVSFSLDTSIYSRVYIDGSLAKRDASINLLFQENDAQDTSIAWLGTNKLGIDSSLSDLSDTSLGGIGSAQDGSTLVYVNSGAYWTYGVGGGGTTINELGDIGDVSVNGRSDGDLIQWENDTSTWDSITPIDISTLAIDASDYFYTKTYIDSSLSALWINQLSQDASIVSIRNVNTSQDASIVSIRNVNTSQDASIVSIRNVNTSQDASIVALRTKNTNQDTSINAIWTNQLSQDASIVSIRNVNTSQDASILLRTTKVYVDGSLALRDVSIAWLAANLGSGYLYDLSDVSINSRSDGDLIQYNNDTSTWDNIAPVDISSLTLEASSYFIQGSGTLDDVSMGGLGTAQDGSIISWVADGSYWTYSPYNDIQDGSITALYTHDAAQDVSIAWLNTNKLHSDASLSDLSDVSTGGVATGDVLVYNSGIWEKEQTVELGDVFVLKSNEAYGQLIIHDASLTQAIATGSTYKPIGPWTQHQNFQYNVEEDPSVNSFFLVPQITGKYMVNCQMSYKCDTNNIETKAAVFLDDAEQDWIHFADYRGVGANIISSASMTGIIDVSTLDSSIGVRLKHQDVGTVTYTFYYANLNIHRIGD